MEANLLLGVLALRLGFLRPEALAAVLRAWVQDPQDNWRVYRGPSEPLPAELTDERVAAMGKNARAMLEARFTRRQAFDRWRGLLDGIE